MDPKNSIILSPNYDKLFDLGYITFNPDNGKIILSDKIDSNNWEKLKINDDAELAFIPKNTDKYLSYHNTYIFNFVASQETIIENLVN